MDGLQATGEHGAVSELFARVVCGVDPSEAGEVAARVAGRVTDPNGSLRLVSVDDSSLAVHAGWQAPAVAAELLREAQAALERGRIEAIPAHAVELRLHEGDPRRCLLAEIEQAEATLVVLGSHGLARAVGIALGSVATHLLHEAPCSVLIARNAGTAWPQSVTVGVDGSAESAAAFAVARELAGHLGVSLRAVAAAGERHVDVAAARAIAPELEELPGKAVDELHELSESTDLIVVGSRGLKGLHALGSVSERVAHDALCSVLVVHSEGASTR
jgi:nucleotide-binding universal stress UspA family protein